MVDRAAAAVPFVWLGGPFGSVFGGGVEFFGGEGVAFFFFAGGGEGADTIVVSGLSEIQKRENTGNRDSDDIV